MLPQLTVFGFSVSTYGPVIGLYLALAFPLTVHLNRKQGIGHADTLAIFALAVPAGALGSRALDALEYWDNYHSVADYLGRNGSSIYGGLIAGFGVAWLYLRSRHVLPLKFFDAGAPAMALGEAMTRIGCFLNGCCYGIPWQGPWAVTFPPESFAFQDQLTHELIKPAATRTLPVHPVQLYGTIVMLAVFLYLWRKFLHRHEEGEVFCAFLVAYGVWRLLVAPLRVEALNSMKVFSALFILVGTVGLLVQQRRASALRLSGASR